MRFKHVIIASLGFILFSCGSEESSTDDANNAISGNNNNNADHSDVKTDNTGNVSIAGTMDGGAGSMVYLYKYGTNPVVTFDSIIIENNGSFSFMIEQQGYDFLGIGFQSNNAALLLVGTGDEIMVNGTSANWARDYQVTGTGYSSDIRNYLLNRQEFTDQVNMLKAEQAATPKSDQIAQDKINAKGEALQEKFIATRDQFIKDLDDTPALFIALQDIYDPISDIDKVKIIAKATNKYMPNSMLSDQVNGLLGQIEQQLAYEQQVSASPAVVAIGKPAPDLNFATPEGKNLSLSSLKGKVVLLDFWASWCKPCRMENPNVVNLYNQYKDKGFTVYSVSLDNNKAQWMNAIQADGLVWPNHVSDLGGWNSLPAAIYGVNSIPQTYLIGKDGIIIAKDLRGIDLANKLKEILG